MLVDSIYRNPRLDQNSNRETGTGERITLLKRRKHRNIRDTDPHPLGETGKRQIVQTPDYLYKTLPQPIHLPSDRLMAVKSKHARREIIQSKAGRRSNLTDVGLVEDVNKLLDKVQQQGSIYTMVDTQNKIKDTTRIDPTSLFQPKRDAITLETIQQIVASQAGKFEAAEGQRTDVNEQTVLSSLKNMQPQEAKLDDTFTIINPPKYIPASVVKQANDEGGFSGIFSAFQNADLSKIKEEAEKVIVNQGQLAGENAYPFSDSLNETDDEVIRKKLDEAKDQVLESLPSIGASVAGSIGATYFGAMGGALIQPAIESVAKMVIQNATMAIDMAYKNTIGKIPSFSRFKNSVLAAEKAILYFKSILQSYVGKALLETIKFISANPGKILAAVGIAAATAIGASKYINPNAETSTGEGNPAVTFNERIPGSLEMAPVAQRLIPAGDGSLVGSFANGALGLAGGVATTVTGAAAGLASSAVDIASGAVDSAIGLAGWAGNGLVDAASGIVNVGKAMASNAMKAITNKANEWVANFKYSLEEKLWGVSQEVDFVKKMFQKMIAVANVHYQTPYSAAGAISTAWKEFLDYYEGITVLLDKVSANLLPLMEGNEQRELSEKLTDMKNAMYQLHYWLNGAGIRKAFSNWWNTRDSKNTVIKDKITAVELNSKAFLTVFKKIMTQYYDKMFAILPSEWLYKITKYQPQITKEKINEERLQAGISHPIGEDRGIFARLARAAAGLPKQ